MTEQDILQLRDWAEAEQVQFKERIASKDDKYEIGCEMVAFSNSRGGRYIMLPYTGAGSGVRRALEYDPDVIFSNGVDQREITHSANEFVITIPRKNEQVTDPVNLVTDPAQAKTDPVNDQASSKTDPAQYKTDQVSDQVTQKTDQPQQGVDPSNDQPHKKIDQVHRKVKLSKKQLDITNFCSVPRTTKEILERAGVTNHFYNRTKYIYDLVEAGILERTIPDEPNDPNQKYRRKQ